MIGIAMASGESSLWRAGLKTTNFGYDKPPHLHWNEGPIWVFVMVGGCFAIAFPFFLLSFRLLRLDDAKVIEVDEDGAKDNEVN